jgi:hypothetical protein
VQSRIDGGMRHAWQSCGSGAGALRMTAWRDSERKGARALGGALGVCEQALNQRLQLLARQRRDPHQACIEGLQLCFAHRVKADAMNALVSARPLQPAEENLGGARVRDCAFSQASLDLRIARRFAVTTRCASVSHGRWDPRCAGGATLPRRKGVYFRAQLLSK